MPVLLRCAFFLVLILAFRAVPAQASYVCHPDATCTHALAIWGDPKYPTDFQHFDYVNPDASKGGDVTQVAIGTYDNLNGFILKGVSAAGMGMIYDTLLTKSEDEPFTGYGLLAEGIELANDRSWVIFHLRPEAKWHDGVPITAEDVVFTFNTKITEGHPHYRSYYREVEKVEALSAHQVKFTFSSTTNRELPLIVGEMGILPKHYYDTVDFTKTTLEPPLGSGPYKVEQVDAGKSIRYVRVPDYWGKDLPVNRGQNNFGSITYEYYRDATVAIEAFKAGKYDLRSEYISKVWATAYDIPAVKDGRIIKEEIPHENPTGMQAFVMNLRRDKFSDPRVREALGCAFDFEWTNHNIFYDAYTRTTSYFSNSEYASSGLPEGKELVLLESLKDKVPSSVFTEKFTVPVTDGSGNNREQLRKAKALLEEAGWVVKDGVRVNAETGQPLDIEILLSSPAYERPTSPFVRNLKRLGIQASIRTIDAAQYIKRMEEFDFDMVIGSFGQSLSPGNEQKDYWHSSSADIPGSRNVAGIKDEAVDILVEKVVQAESKEDLVAAAHALDRVLLHHHYVIPQYHVRSFRVAHWNRFGKPAVRPKYSLGFGTWWVDPEKDAALER
ncbi:MAG: ABC transporter substrate-binding protein [Rickettsiales bacterium]|nr:ABC transporter substrate-binding protein [Rickettsiales bacterium]